MCGLCRGPYFQVSTLTGSTVGMSGLCLLGLKELSKTLLSSWWAVIFKCVITFVAWYVAALIYR